MTADPTPAGATRAPGPVAAAAGGALAGFVALVLVATARSVLRHAAPRFDDSAWLAVVVLLVVAAAFLAGWVAGRRAPTGSTLVVGAVAAAAAVAAWVPVRVVIWIARDEHRGLVSGSDPVLRAGPLLANLALAAVVGAVAARLAARPTPDPDHA